MTRMQQKEIENRYPFSKGRVYRISSDGSEDVVDPYRRGRSIFEASLAQIEKGLVRWTNEITRLNK
ncbi:protein tyrosine phosphatase [Burkholderia sp. KJ006]|nr:protein tyrosine phosphatase [Burkholderia sp. KJ006]